MVSEQDGQDIIWLLHTCLMHKRSPELAFWEPVKPFPHLPHGCGWRTDPGHPLQLPLLPQFWNSRTSSEALTGPVVSFQVPQCLWSHKDYRVHIIQTILGLMFLHVDTMFANYPRYFQYQILPSCLIWIMVNLWQVQTEIKRWKTLLSNLQTSSSVSALFWLPPPTSVVALQYFCLHSLSPHYAPRSSTCLGHYHQKLFLSK